MTQSQSSTTPLPSSDVKPPRRQHLALTIIGWILTILPVGLLFMSATFKLSKNPVAVEGFAKAGFPEGSLFWIGVTEVACTLLYLFPKTAILGAILLTGYLGGAVVVHLLAKEPWVFPIIFGMVIWLGIFLREPKLRTILFWRCA